MYKPNNGGGERGQVLNKRRWTLLHHVSYRLCVILHRLRSTWRSLVFVNEVAHRIVGGVSKACRMGHCRKHFEINKTRIETRPTNTSYSFKVCM